MPRRCARLEALGWVSARHHIEVSLAAHTLNPARAVHALDMPQRSPCGTPLHPWVSMYAVGDRVTISPFYRYV